MPRLHLAYCSIMVLAASACTDATEPFDPLQEDAQITSGAPQGDAGAERVVVLEHTPKVGDQLAGGSVVTVDAASSSNGRCMRVVVEHAAKWQCSEPLIQEAQTGGYTVDGRPEGGLVAVERTEAESLQVMDCKGLAALRRPELKQTMRTMLRNQRQQQLQDCLPTQSALFFNAQGEQISSCPSGAWATRDAGSSKAASPSASSAGSGKTSAGASQYSTTNTQVDGVDEPDFVKNDAQYVYVLANDGLHVIDAWPAPETRELKRLPLPGRGTRLFLSGSRLVVYVRPDEPAGAPSAAQACTYGYDCKFGAEPGRTTTIVYDVSDPSAPKELARYDLSGGYVAARRVGSMVHTVVYDRPGVVAPPLANPLDASGPTAFETSYQAALASVDGAVDALADEDFLPWVQQARANGAREKVAACDRALAAQSASGLSFTSVVSFDLNTLDAPHRTMVASKPGFIYASGSALYMATEGADGDDRGNYYAYRGLNELSGLHKFVLEPAGTRYVGTATVRGHVLNQFAMDEQAGVLRVATSSGQVPDPDVSSNLTTFSEVSGKFAKLGELTGLAPQEDIRSVRFDGTRGFVVTFKKTDPLYVIDLSEPERPTVLGELKIPGFSTYMHPLDHDHLLALGFEADDQGSFAYFNGIQIQIFDVAQLDAPKLMHKTVIGTRGSASDALTNHLAFNYFAAQSLLALPMTICDGGGQGAFGDMLSFSGLMVFDVSLTTGVSERGRMPFVEAAQSASIQSCSSWWTQTTSVVKRSIIMDDYTIGISDDRYKVAPTADLDTPLASLPLSSTP